MTVTPSSFQNADLPSARLCNSTGLTPRLVYSGWGVSFFEG